MMRCLGMPRLVNGGHSDKLSSCYARCAPKSGVMKRIDRAPYRLALYDSSALAASPRRRFMPWIMKMPIVLLVCRSIAAAASPDRGHTYLRHHQDFVSTRSKPVACTRMPLQMTAHPKFRLPQAICISRLVM